MRVTDEKYLPCPICGKKPIALFYYSSRLSLDLDVDVYCRGSLFRRHKKIGVSMAFVDPNYLRSLWNEEVERNIKRSAAQSVARSVANNADKNGV